MNAGPRVQSAGSDGGVLRLRTRGNYSVSVRAHFAAGRLAPPASSPIICATAIDGPYVVSASTFQIFLIFTDRIYAQMW